MEITSHLLSFTGKEAWLSLATDVTERLSLEAQLRQSQKMESVGQLAGGIAHDFNNLLTVINGHAGLLLAKEKLTPQIADPLKEISNAAKRAADLTRQLLTFSRKQTILLQVVDLNEAVNNVTKMLRRILGEDITLDAHFSPELPCIKADLGMVEQVLMNLSVNSRDAMPKGGQLRINTFGVAVDEHWAHRNPEAIAGDFVCLSFADTGCGIPRENLQRIFEPFFTTKALDRGTGLGLATVYGIIKQHQGWIEVKSEVGAGTNFQIYLPASDKRRSAATEFFKKGMETAKGSRETILLVEDEAIVRQWVKEILVGCDYRVVEAAHGVEALKVWDEQEGKIDLLITDMVMPEGLTGGELAQRLKSKQPLLKIIYTSGYSAEIMGNAAGLPEGPFLAKPYASPQLARMVRDCLDAGITAK
jgi:nitrogen-specific signal transduction histidine kinase